MLYTRGAEPAAVEPPFRVGTANAWPVASARPAASRTRQVPLTGSALRGTRTTKERDAMSTEVRKLARILPLPLPVSRSCAPRELTTRARSMPGEDTLAWAGHADRPVLALPSISKVQAAIGTLGSTRVFQSTRQIVASSTRPAAARKMSAPLSRAAPAG